MTDTRNEFNFVNRRFDRDAGVFAAIYNDDEKGLTRWLNKTFRKPIYERFDIAMKAMGDVRGKKVIDVGCGTGIYAASLAAKGAQHVLGVDLSQAMLTIAADKVRSMGLEGQCRFQRGNFLEADFSEKFDYALAMGVFDYLSDPATFLRKLKSVTTNKVIASFPSYSLIRGPLRQLRYLLTFRGNVYYYTRADVEKLAREAGFTEYQLVPAATGSGYILLATP